MYIIIDGQYRIYRSGILSGRIRRLARQGKLSVIVVQGADTRKLELKGMNLPNRQSEFGGEWSDIQKLPPDFEVRGEENPAGGTDAG